MRATIIAVERDSEKLEGATTVVQLCNASEKRGGLNQKHLFSFLKTLFFLFVKQKL